MLNISAALPLLAQPKRIFITTHHKPDADALGSSLGLYHYLKQKGHAPTVVSPSEIPDFLQWMPGMDSVLNFEAESKKALEVLTECDLIFCLDFNSLNRIKLLEKPLREAVQPKILIDHHLLPEVDVFAYGSSEPEKSSTCEMVYDFIINSNGEAFLSPEVMQCLYAGLMTDTGSFRFPVTSASVHNMIADFKNRGLEHSEIHNLIYDSWSENRMRFLGYILYEKMEIFPEQKTGLIALSKEELEKFKAASGDTEGMVNYPLSIQDINLSVLLIERKDGVKISFRSKGDIDVSALARDHFNGGGHFNAAGGQSSDSLEGTVAKIKKLLSL
jgi:phosphoesterase RecJ-like protein